MPSPPPPGFLEAAWHFSCLPHCNEAGEGSRLSMFSSEQFCILHEFTVFFLPPTPPPQTFRHFLKMNKSNSELDNLCSDSAENLRLPFQGGHVTFTAGSMDSLDLATNQSSHGGSLI